jgi:hypothetical protein
LQLHFTLVIPGRAAELRTNPESCGNACSDIPGLCAEARIPE